MKKIYISAFTLLLAVASFAQVDRSKMPEPGPAPKIKLGETQSFTLENGLQVFVVENHKLPRVAFSLVLDVDPMKEGDKSGMADLAGDLMSKGTTNRSKEEINFSIDFIGAQLSTSATSVYGASLKKHQNKLLEIMADVVKNADFKQEELDKLKTQYISGIQSEKDDPDAIASNVRRVLLYGKDHPYGEITTEKTVENVTLEDVKNYYNTFFKPNVAYLAVVGDINVAEAKPLVKKYFGDWKKGEVPTFEYPMPEKPKVPEVAFVNKPGAVQSVIVVANTIDLKPGSADDIKASITNGVLGGGFVSKLNLNLREEHAYTYGARSSINSDELVGNFFASAKVRNEVTDSALTETLKELMAMRKGEITQEELDAQKNYRTGTFAYSLENPQTKARFAINTAKYNLPADYYSNYLKNVAAVTLEDAKAMSAKYINPMQGFILIVGNKEEVADKLKAFSPTGKVNFYDTYGNEAVETLQPAPEGITAQAVVNDYIKAIGGEKELMKIKSMKKVADVSIPGAPPITLEINQTKDGKFMSNMAAGAMTVQKQIFDGIKGRTMGMQGNEDMSEDDIKRMKIDGNMFPELKYSNEDIKLSLKGIDTFNEESCYVVDVTFPNGDVKTDYYAIGTKYLIGSVEMVGEGDQKFQKEDSFSDYKKVGKIMMPYKASQNVGPQTISMEYKTIEINKKVDPQIFYIETE